SLAAAVRRLAGRLHEQQALAGRQWEQASAAIFFDEEFKIFIRVETEQAQLEAVLTARFAVATAAVAAELGEDRDDLILEVDWYSLVEAFDMNRPRSRQSVAGDRQRCVAVFRGSHQARRIDIDDAGRLGGVLHLASVIAKLAARITARHVDLLPSITATQH